jgi:hypothetical protein
VERNQASSNWVTKAAVYSLASSLTGIVTGALLGGAGGFLPLEPRVAIASLLGVIAIILGTLEIGGRRVRLPQLDHETPQSWMNAGPLRWAARNGFTLGLGAISRIGFPLWYAVPAGAFLLARPDLGSIVYGTYSTTRAMAVWALILGVSRWLGRDYQDRLIGRARAARILTAAQLVLLGMVVVVAVGL